MTKMTIIEDRQPTLEEAKAAVGGFVQMIVLPSGDQMLMDEDGKFKDRQVNEEATEAARDVLRDGDFVVGDVLVLRGKARWR